MIVVCEESSLPAQGLEASSYQDWAREALYGSDQVLVVPPKELAHKGIELLGRACEYVGAAARQALDLQAGPGLPELSESVSEALRKTNEALLAAQSRLANSDLDRPFRVVLMGRTMAGKSTLFEFLSRGDGERVGDGRQRYSRDVCRRTVPGLDIEIVDTPGVGARDGLADQLMAFDEVADADLILWVATDQATQEQTGQALTALADLGKPILVALNCLADVEDDIGLWDMLEAPEMIFGGDAEDNLAPIRRHLSLAGGHYLDAIPIHAQAARLASAGTLSPEDSSKLLANSRLDELTGSIRGEFERTASIRRLMCVSDYARCSLLETSARLAQQSVDVSDWLIRYRGRAHDFHLRARRLIDDAHQELRLVARGAVASRERWAERVRIEQPISTLNVLWRSEMDALEAELKREVGRVAEQLQQSLREAQLDVDQDWETSGFRLGNPGGLGRLWVKRGARLVGIMSGSLVGAVTGAKIGAAVGTIFGPGLGTAIGGAVGFIAGGVVGSTLVAAIDWTVIKVLGGSAALMRRRRQRLHQQVTLALSTTTKVLDERCNDLLRGWVEELDRGYQQAGDTGNKVQTLVADLDDARDQVLRILRECDLHLARALLGAQGRARAARAVRRAAHWHGAGLAVELTEPAYSELLLYPPAVYVERLLATSARSSPTGQAVQLARALSDQGISRPLPGGGVEVAMDTLPPEGIREAWAALIQEHTGCDVRFALKDEGVCRW